MSRALEDQVIEVVDRPSSEQTRFEPSPRWVRAFFGGVAIADSRRVRLLLEPKHLPIYYFPVEDVRMELLQKGEGSYWTVQVGERVAHHAAWERAEFPGFVAFYWDRMDAWFEEDDEVFAHPRDPYHRVDVLHSSRSVQVVVAGQTVAETLRPRLLFETGLPTRYYLPKVDVRMDLLSPTDTTTRCPYKGKAIYWALKIDDRQFKDIVWSYSPPTPECAKIDNLLCFFNERVDAIYVDGQVQPVPKTPWS